MVGRHWIPVDVDIDRCHEVVEIAAKTGRSRHEVVGLMICFWGWVIRQSKDGKISSFLFGNVTQVVGGDEAFWTAVVDAGWLKKNCDGIQVPRWNKWLAKSTRYNIVSALRQKRFRNKRNKNVTKKSYESNGNDS